jgi:hypothetical protein
MREIAISVHGTLLKTKSNLSIHDNLAEVERRLAAMYPDKVKAVAAAATDRRERDRDAGSASVEGGSRQPVGSGSPRGKSWADIPRDDRTAIEKSGMVKHFLPRGVDASAASERDLAAARASYDKEYWSQP